MSASPYRDFLDTKAAAAPATGFKIDPSAMPRAMKPFQSAVTSWALQRGRGALFEGTGLGKTVQELAWARAVHEETRKPVLTLAPLAVAEQTVLEAAKFDVDGVAYAADQGEARTPIVVTNYDRAHLFDFERFGGVVLDESSILKAQDGKTRQQLTDACRTIPYRLPASATPAPNDWTEIGQHAEFLGVMGAKEMLAMYFVHDGSNRLAGGDGWRLKRHAEQDFWRWVASWSVMIRSPADLGFDDPGYVLPPLIKHQITVPADYAPAGGLLFPMEANTLQERLRARRTSLRARVRACVDLVLHGIGEQWPSTEKNTCADGTLRTEITPEPIAQPPRSRETLGGVSATPPIPSTPTSAASPPGAGTPAQNETAGSAPSSGLGLKNTRPSSKARITPAQSVAAERGSSEAAPTDSPSTTATKPELSEACSAPNATSPLASSVTIRIASAGRLSTSWRDVEKPWLIWCQLNDEQDALTRAFGDRAFSVYGSMTSAEKVAAIRAWVSGDRPVMISKPSIMGFGLNFQHCADMIFVGLNDSFEQLYQALRRCWRFGQTRPVNAYLIASELEGAVVANLERKEREFEAMAEAMAEHMRDLTRAAVRGGRIAASNQQATTQMELPSWLAA